MTRRIKRSNDFAIEVTIENADFIPTPRDSQRSWLLNRAIGELSDELDHLNRVSGTFVRGADHQGAADRESADLADAEIMEDWQIPVMRRMAAVVSSGGGDVLEIGFGRGISARFIQEHDVRSHTIIECNDALRHRFEEWRDSLGDRDIRYVAGRWQEVIGPLGQFDAILLHTYPLNDQEYLEQVVKSVTFAEHFFPAARSHLRSGGVFTYFSGESFSLSRAHQRLLLDHFSSFTVEVETGLDIPQDTRDAIWADSLIIVSARK